jgi:hypothetical protein
VCNRRERGRESRKNLNVNRFKVNIMIEKYLKENKIIGGIFAVFVLMGAVMLFMNIKIGIDGKTLILLTAVAIAAYQDSLIRKLFKQLKDKENNQQANILSQCGESVTVDNL